MDAAQQSQYESFLEGVEDERVRANGEIGIAYEDAKEAVNTMAEQLAYFEDEAEAHVARCMEIGSTEIIAEARERHAAARLAHANMAETITRMLRDLDELKAHVTVASSAAAGAARAVVKAEFAE